jgi:RimJ/RimL family protein N-acetyltransferase
MFLRQWVPDDWKRFWPLGTDPRVLEFLPTEPWSDERIQRFINKGIEVAKKRGWILWPVIHREDAELIGFCGFSDEFSPEVEIGWRFRLLGKRAGDRGSERCHAVRLRDVRVRAPRLRAAGCE